MFHAFTDTFSLVVTGVQCLNLFAGLNEVQAPTAYSKFASKSAALSIPSLYGMLVIYTPATCAAASSPIEWPSRKSGAGSQSAHAR